RAPKVLVVDDEHLIRWSLRQRLEDEGFEIVEAAHGEEALEQFRKGVDLVLLDWLLPDINGQEVLRQMRALSPTIPVIMLTAHSSVEHAVDVMKEGAFHYAGKPFDLDEVVDTVQIALRATTASATCHAPQRRAASPARRAASVWSQPATTTP
ncbi:MAG: response regulator, partial [Acidobacteria bacterium]|nr:response regulator [Acidobacteriota bacterium]